MAVSQRKKNEDRKLSPVTAILLQRNAICGLDVRGDGRVDLSGFQKLMGIVTNPACIKIQILDLSHNIIPKEACELFGSSLSTVRFTSSIPL
jgi:hypothetical protein